MEGPGFIKDESSLNPGMDYDFLRSEGIKFIQELTGAFWTDYNEHDPGVTILEQLCYALTDLSYRTGFDIQDLLSGSFSQKSFHHPDLIFPSNPLTPKDFRKVILDEVKQVRNVWLKPTSPFEHSLKGLYKIYVDTYEPLDSDKLRPEAIEQKTEALHRNIHSVFSRYRSLCEDIDEIILLKPLEVLIFADIEIERTEDIEDILARIIFNLEKFLNPEVHFYDLHELVDQGENLADIYQGPLLQHGFIPDGQLEDKLERLVISEIIKMMMQVPEVTSVKNVYLKVEGQIEDNQLSIPYDHFPKIKYNLGKSDYTINFYKNGVNYDQISPNFFNRKLNEFQSAHKRVYRPHQERPLVPKGQPRNLKEYYSIQNQFPAIYGIGTYGIPEKPSPKRLAQARQLKGYLLLFEQIMANYLAQLSHVKDLFSLNSQSNRTYFFQNLDQVPDVSPLYCREEKELVKDVHLGETVFAKDYYLGLKALVENQDDFSQRQNHFLDFLLAVHGEAYGQYSLSQKNFYFSLEAFQEFLIVNKTRFLKHLPILNRDRARAFDYLKNLDENQDGDRIFGRGNISGLEKKIAILLGLDHVFQLDEGHIYRQRWIRDAFEEQGLKTCDKESPLYAFWLEAGDIRQVGLDNDLIETHFDFVDDADLLELDPYPEDRMNILKKTILYRSEDNLVSNAFLKSALHPEFYLIGRVEGTDYFHLVFKNPDYSALNNAQKYLWIGQFGNETQAHEAAQVFLHFMRDLNMQGEGFYLMEHILLRPQVGDEKFGFYILDEEGEIFLRTTRRFNFQSRYAALSAFKEYIEEHRAKGLYENFYVEQRAEDRDFEIFFRADGLDFELMSVKAFDSVHEVHEKLDQVYEFLIDSKQVIDFDEKISYYIQRNDQGRRVPESFFNHQVSIIFPDWTARFHQKNREFRAVVEHLINENKPANLKAEILWVDFNDMKNFERNYQAFIEKYRTNAYNGRKEIEKISNHLIQLLLLLYDKKQKPDVRGS